MAINELRAVNRARKIYDTSDRRFQKYGRNVTGYDFGGFAEYLRDKTDIPEEGNVYVASVPEMEELPAFKNIQDGIYGQALAQAGYCNGNNSFLNGLEYHKCTETIHAVTDIVLLLGNVWDITDNSYSAERVEAFYLPKGSSVELYGTTLHFAPCKVYSTGFKALIILSKGTNTELVDNSITSGDSESELLFMNNKWLIAHPDAVNLVKNNAHIGIRGENVEIKSL